ncbi:nickel/cobalt homeostasis protein RcnB [Escherichia coli]|nr:nickel/cobalt homeostasis protein RcnB [Escherichia coli]
MTIKNKMLLGALLLVTSAAWAAPATAGSTNTSGISKYELSSFIADFKHFKPGDTVPEMYRTDEYNIKQWQLRNLPAPDAGTHWTYMGGAYVLISDTDGKIIKAYDGEIFIIAKKAPRREGECRHLNIFIISHLLVLLVISRISR